MAGRVRHRKRGPVDYRRTPRPPVKRPRLDIDLDLLAELREIPLGRDGNHLSPTGRCHDCDRPVTGERKFCGPCLAGHGPL